MTKYWSRIVITLCLGSVRALAGVSWGTPTNDTGNASDIITGDVVVAVFMGDDGYGTNQVSSDVTVNGVTFGYQIGTTGTFNTYSNISITDPGYPGGNYGDGAPSSWDSGYGEITEFGDGTYDGASPEYFTISGLIIGDTYELQIFTPWWNQGFDGTTYSDGTNTSAPLNIGVNTTGTPSQYPQYIIGTFTATSTSIDIYPYSPGGGGEDFLTAALVLIDTTTVSGVPEPGSFALAAGGLLLAGLLGRGIKARSGGWS